MTSKFLLLTLIVVVSISQAQDDLINEDELFSDTSFLVDSSAMIQSFSMGAVESTQVNFSGEITSTGELGLKRDWFVKGGSKYASPKAYIVGNILLDARFPMGFKAFANTEVQYLADSGTARFSLQEMFLDANIQHLIYFRTGKQVLKWGRCYFWNPTDLINVERKKFVEDVGYLEGAYGIKTHIPIGTKLNFYSFLDMRNLTGVDSLAGAAKLEFLVGGTEIGAAVWGKKSKDPFFGLDLSSTLFDFNLTGEVGLTSGRNYTVMTENLTPARIDEDIVARACLGVSRTFDLLEVDDRVSAHAEVYYNQAGYEGNVFKEYNIGDLIDSLNSLPEGDPRRSGIEGMAGSFIEPNNHSRWYGAFFFNVNKFIISEMQLIVNGIMNFNHRSAVLSTGLQYRSLHNFSMGLLVNTIIGSQESEYTLFGDAASIRLTAGVAF